MIITKVFVMVIADPKIYRRELKEVFLKMIDVKGGLWIVRTLPWYRTVGQRL